MRTKKIATGVAFSLLVANMGCNYDKLADTTTPSSCEVLQPTYETTIKPIIDKSCAYVGCHIAGFPSGNYSTYDGMLSRLNSGDIEQRAINFRNMPPSDAPAGKPTSLTTEELEIFSCWLANGFPKN